MEGPVGRQPLRVVPKGDPGLLTRGEAGPGAGEVEFISKKRVCSRQIGIASGRRKSVWSILSAQSALRWPQHNGCILVRWVQYNPHPAAQWTWMVHFTP